MSVGFGFSAGDFIAAVGLVANVTKALKDVGGASEEYQSLVLELESLERVVRKLHDRKGAEGVFPPDITQQTKVTLNTLGSFLGTISKFKAKLGSQAAPGRHHGAGRKAQWAVLYANEVEKLRVKLGMELAQLNMLLQLYASARVEALAATLANVPSAIEAQDRQMLALQQKTSTNIDNLGSQIQRFGSSQEAILDQQHSVVLAQFQAARDDIQQGHGRIATLSGSINLQTQQLATLTQDTGTYHSTALSRMEETSQYTQEGMQLLSRKSDLILHAISQPRRTEPMTPDNKDDVLFLLFQLLHAVSKSMGNLLLKAGLLLPFILSTVERMTTTIRRQPYLLVEDSINFTDMRGRNYTMHYEYFQHWSNFAPFFHQQMQDVIKEEKKSLRLPVWGHKTYTFVKLVTMGGIHSLPLKSDDEWEVAPGDRFSAKLESLLRIRHANGQETRFTHFVVTLSWLPPAPIEY